MRVGLGTDFEQNQDIPRFANHTSDISLATNVATFVIMSDGIPIIYQGQEQHFSGGTNPFTNREPVWEKGFNVFAPIYQHIAVLNTLRQHAIKLDKDYTTTQADVLHQDDHILIMAKGSKGSQVITVYNNNGAGADDATWNLDVSSLGYKGGSQLTEVLSCKNYTIGSDGTVSFPMSGGLPQLLYPAASLSQSSLCGEGGPMFNEKIVNQTVTMTTYTTTLGSAPTVMVASATVPIGEAEQTGGAPNSTASSIAAPRLASPIAGAPFTVIAMAVAGGVLVSLLGR